jgi:transcriptional regulator with XRE-family HTH domain
MQARLSPTLRRRKLAAQLQTLRIEHGLTEEQVAMRLDWSPSKMSRMETDHNIATPCDIRDLCDLYEVNEFNWSRSSTRPTCLMSQFRSFLSPWERIQRWAAPSTS